MSHFVTAKFYMYVDKRTELRNISLHFRRRFSSDIYIVCESRRKCYEESIEFLFSFIISSIRENGSRRKYFFVLFKTTYNPLSTVSHCHANKMHHKDKEIRTFFNFRLRFLQGSANVHLFLGL